MLLGTLLRGMMQGLAAIWRNGWLRGSDNPHRAKAFRLRRSTDRLRGLWGVRHAVVGHFEKSWLSPLMRRQ